MNQKELKELVLKVKVAADRAGYIKLTELQKNGPKYSVYNSDVFGNTIGKPIGQMLDICGGAFIKISGRNPLINAIKKAVPEDNGYVYENWWITKGYPKGYTIHIRHACSQRQEYSVAVAAMKAASEVLNENGINCYVHDYID